MRCKTRVLVIVLALLALAPTMARAQGIIPRTVSYQGRLTVAGIPFEGMGRFKFAVLDSAGRSRWSNDGSSVNGSEPSAAVSLPVTAGLFSALLGDPALDMQPLTSGAFADPGSVLRVWFSGDGVAYQQLTPDCPFSSAPYAHVANVSAYAENADTVDGLHAADLAPKHHTHWGAIWEGEQFGLTLRNTGANPAAVNLAFHGNALTVDNARYDGILVSKADDDGIQIGVPPLLPGGSYLGPKDDGIEIWHVGNPSTHTMPADAGLGNTHDGVAIAGAEGFGVWVGYAGQSGLRVQRSEANALHVESTGGSGLRVRSAALDGVNVGQAAYSGIAVGQAGRDG
ncbi:MAG: hypothetical protein FJZ90_16575, partial [Chloroflexi bacterium]|nr:hypothetical protein [Chloroflexota bacterium]